MCKPMKKKQTGWRPIPLALKVLFVVFILWSVGAIFDLPNLYELGLPLFGTFVYGIMASLVVLLLDIIGPIGFLYALWNRKSWGVVWALSYISIFILNSIVALITVREQLGFPQILAPTIISIIFVIVIYAKRNYFK